MVTKSPLLALVLVVPFFLSSCGDGGGGTASSDTVINGISVPPEPDPTANNATLAGIDSNSNGVRDDVERKIAENIKNPIDFDATKKVAVAYQEMLLSTAPTTRDDALRLFSLINCAATNSTGEVHTGKNGRFLLDETFNTNKRQDIYLDIAKLAGAFFGSDLPACP